jgi:hypothetical protein
MNCESRHSNLMVRIKMIHSQTCHVRLSVLMYQRGAHSKDFHVGEFYEHLSRWPWCQASAAMLMKSVVFWVITRRRVVIIYRRFGKTYRSHHHGSRFRVGKKAYNIENGKHSGVAKRVMWWQPIGWERGWIQPTYSCCVDRESKQPRQLENIYGIFHIHLATPLCFPVSML